MYDRNNDGRLTIYELRAQTQDPNDDWQNRPQFDDWTAEGFRYLDRNRDGRVSRTEWSHDRASFTRADRNGDGVLTRAEFLATESVSEESPREERFETLDANNNGRIERYEWRGRDERFDTLDRNNDGVISRVEMLDNRDDDESRDFANADFNRDNRLSQSEWRWAQRVFTQQDQNRDGYVSREEFWNPGASSVVGTGGYADNRTVNSPVVIQVSATERWVDTGLDTRAGDILRITSTGSVRLSPDSGDYSNPGGANRRAPQAPLPFHPAGALIGRISNGAPFFIGDGTNIDRVQAAGRLYLSVNDDHLGDNSGTYRVTITIRPQ
jgi:Ca2+-binding EF-hand superfamily protein